jgi:SAM-dependent methyltransferase
VWRGTGRGGVRRVLRCGACQTGYNDPPTDERSLAAHYSAAYFSDFYGGDRRPATDRQQPFLAAAEEHLGGHPGRLLDIGCGVGDLCAAARDRGWSVVGMELSPEAAARAAERGVEVLVGEAAELLAGGRQQPEALRRPFDLIVLRDALVHMPQAATVLTATSDLLRPGGWMAIRVPNRHRGIFRVARWAAHLVDASGILHLPAQVFHLDRPALETLLVRQGLTDIQVVGESEEVAATGGRYSRNPGADMAWRLLVRRWQRRGEPEALWGWGRHP